MFAYDDDQVGEQQRWFGVRKAARFDQTIIVPYPPESPASGIGDTDFHPVVWYRRRFTADELPSLEADERLIVHFGAVDFSATVWCNGDVVGTHVGGQTPFAVDITAAASANRSGDGVVLVVRAVDDPEDRELPRGKQDWKRKPHGIWYHRTTGIWQSVWAEAAPATRIQDLAWTSDRDAGVVRCEVTLASRPARAVAVDIALAVDGEQVGHGSATTATGTAVVEVAIDRWSQVRDRLTWSPANPVLIDAEVEVRGARLRRRTFDKVTSYTGIRSVGVGRGRFLLNGEPYDVRAVLDQGYRPDTHLANAGPEALRDEVEQILALGFNTVRVHQKAEDPRFLYWADRLGLLVWGEVANSYVYSTRSSDLLTREWLDLVRRDRSHPSIVTWVPINESWGVGEIAEDAAQQAFADALARMTRALDPTRPVVSNEGWEHVDSDILGVHDYTSDVALISSRYGDDDAIAATLDSAGPQEKKLILTAKMRERFDRGEIPLMLTEFGGVSYAGRRESWGYTTVKNDDEFAAVLTSVFGAVKACPGVAGFCYTQLVDTVQETNGLLTEDGVPKLPIDRLRAIITA